MKGQGKKAITDRLGITSPRDTSLLFIKPDSRIINIAK
jgi:hypothetical protein